MFCNVFRVYPSNRLDSLSLKLVVANFLLDPFTYVLFKKNFKRNLKQSITELTEFIGDGSFSQRLKKQSSRDNNGNKKENSSRVGHGQFAKTSMFQDDKPCNLAYCKSWHCGITFNLEAYHKVSHLGLFRSSHIWRLIKKIAMAISATAVVNAESWGENVTVARKISASCKRRPKKDYGPSRSLISL